MYVCIEKISLYRTGSLVGCTVAVRRAYGEWNWTVCVVVIVAI